MTRKLLVGGVLKDEFLCLEWPKEIMPQATADMVMGLVQKKFDHRQPQLPVVVYWKGKYMSNIFIQFDITCVVNLVVFMVNEHTCCSQLISNHNFFFYFTGTDGTNHYIEPRQNLYEFFQQNVNLYATFIPV